MFSIGLVWFPYDFQKNDLMGIFICIKTYFCHTGPKHIFPYVLKQFKSKCFNLARIEMFYRN